MNDLATQGYLELEVANFGPIVEAKIDLRPLTVFVGPSNTGKSYLAILIYALHRYFGDNDRGGLRGFSIPYWMVPRGKEQKQRQRTIDALTKWAKQTLADRRRPSDTEKIILPGAVVDEISSLYRANGDGFGNEITRCFGSEEIGALIRKGDNEGAHVDLRQRLDDSVPFEHRVTIKPRGTEFRTTIPKGAPMQIDTGDSDYPIEVLHRLAAKIATKADQPNEKSDFSAWQLIEVLAGFALPHLVGPLHIPAFYLPADRTGVMHAHSVVVSALIESAAMGGLRPAARTPMLSGVLADFLEQLIELDRPLYQRHKTTKRDLAAQIENTIVGGSVRVNRSEATGYPRFTYRPEGWKDDLPLMNASSMVSELAPVVLYLRHMVGPNNLLIIEEPESHLHPAMQVEFTRQIAALVRSGIRVIVTTHSEWVLEELANIVRRSELPEKGRKEVSVSDIALLPSQVGAWLFRPKRRPKGSVVEEVCLDDSGLYRFGFEEVAAALHNDWAEISSQIGDAE